MVVGLPPNRTALAPASSTFLISAPVTSSLSIRASVGTCCTSGRKNLFLLTKNGGRTTCVGGVTSRRLRVGLLIRVMGSTRSALRRPCLPADELCGRVAPPAPRRRVFSRDNDRASHKSCERCGACDLSTFRQRRC